MIGKINQFLLDSSGSNLSVIITSIIASVLTTLLMAILLILTKKLYKGFEITINYLKVKINYIKRRGIRLNIIKIIKGNRNRFKKIITEYNKDKNSYNFIVDGELRKLKYLTSSQNKIRSKIISDNKEKIEEDKRKFEDILKLAKNV